MSQSKKTHSSEAGQERPPIPTSPPIRLLRCANAATRWDLTRTLRGYKAASASVVSIGGKAPKWVLVNDADPDDFYIAKLGSVNGRAETVTELFNNHLGHILGFPMAHFGLARLDTGLYFLTKNFRRPEERLVHGSLMVEEVFVAKKETERIDHKVEQSFYNVDFVKEVIYEFCNEDATNVFQDFINMLVFDALIGSMDRHAQNWGVLQTTSLPRRFRLAPIYDSARALLWLLPQTRLLRYDNDLALLRKYVFESKPCIGPRRNHPKINRCNHFDLIENLMEEYPHQTRVGLQKIPPDIRPIVGRVLGQFPYCRYLSALRRKLMLKLLTMRADTLCSITRATDGVTLCSN